MRVPTTIWVFGSIAVGGALLWGWLSASGYALLAGSALLVVAVGFLTLRVFEVVWRNLHRMESADVMGRARRWLVLLACVAIGLIGGAIVRASRVAGARRAAEAFVPHLDAERARAGRFPATLAALTDAPARPAFAAPTFYEPSDDGTAFTLRLRAETGFVPDVWEYDSESAAWTRGASR